MRTESRTPSAGWSIAASGDAGFDWSLCQTFLAVARHGSMVGAAAELGVSHPTIRRQLTRLEEAVGTQLFSRSQSGMIATPTAMALMPHAEAMEQSARRMLRTVRSDAAVGVVRLAADDFVRTELLPAALRRLRLANPGLHIDLTSAGTARDMLRRQADVALDFVRPHQDGIVVSRLATLDCGLFASQIWLEQSSLSAGKVGDELGRHLVGDQGPHDPAQLVQRDGHDGAGFGYVVRTTDLATTLACVSAGLGVGLLPLVAARRRPELRRLSPESATQIDVWLSVHPDLRSVQHVRVLIDVLRENLGDLA